MRRPEAAVGLAAAAVLAAGLTAAFTAGAAATPLAGRTSAQIAADSANPCAGTFAQTLYQSGLSAIPVVQDPLAAGPVSRTIAAEAGSYPGGTQLACGVSLLDQNLDTAPW
jgi:hypothetical protein